MSDGDSDGDLDSLLGNLDKGTQPYLHHLLDLVAVV